MKKLDLEEIAQQRLSPVEASTAPRFPIYVLLDNIRSLYNVGSIFRTADAARIEKLYLCGITGYPPRREIDKTALGAQETVPWEYYANAVDILKELKQKKIPVIALEHTRESKSYWEYQYDFPCCLVIGNEVWGIQEKLLKFVDAAIEIPMFGAKHSLNASVAFGVAVYEMVGKYLEQIRI
jgi:tRNA G18 (ribose-2'-O)-methylase SpoU